MKVLITGATTASAEYIYKSLESNRFELFLSDSEPLVGDKFIRIPKPDDASFAHKILAICLDHSIAAVIPLLWAEIDILSQSKILFEEYGIKILAPNKKTLDIISVTSRLYSTLSNQQIKVPVFMRVENFDEFSKSILGIGYPSKKIKVQPDTVRSISFRIVDDHISTDELLFPSEDKPAITFEFMARALKKDDFSPILLTEYSESEVLNIHVLTERGETIKSSRENSEGTAALVSGLINHVVKILELDGYFKICLQQLTNNIQVLSVNYSLGDAEEVSELNLPLLYLQKELKTNN